MSRIYDRPIIIQKINELMEDWEDLYYLHARVNKTREDSEKVSAGTTQAKRSLTFEVRYFSGLEAISLNTQRYRILFQGVPYNIESFDDFMLQHKTVKLLGVSY